MSTDGPVTQADFTALRAVVSEIEQFNRDWQERRKKLGDDLRRLQEDYRVKRVEMPSRTTSTTIKTEGETPQEALAALLEDPLGPAMDTIRLRSEAATVRGMYERAADAAQPYRWLAEATVVTEEDQT